MVVGRWGVLVVEIAVEAVRLAVAGELGPVVGRGLVVEVAAVAVGLAVAGGLEAAVEWQNFLLLLSLTEPMRWTPVEIPKRQSRPT